jgi:putative heme-binding domain-containing protein
VGIGSNRRWSVQNDQGRHSWHRNARHPRINDSEAWQILAFLRTLAASTPTDPPRGDAEKGAVVFRALCASCHRVEGVGGRLGPDLSRIGVSRSRDIMVRRIRGSVEGFRQGYEPVTVTPPNGAPIYGVKKNEDLFSVQIMDSGERIQGYEKDKMKAVENGTRSAMPAFASNRLSDADLDNLASYLQTLRGFIQRSCSRGLHARHDISRRSCCSLPAPPRRRPSRLHRGSSPHRKLPRDSRRTARAG